MAQGFDTDLTGGYWVSFRHTELNLFRVEYSVNQAAVPKANLPIILPCLRTLAIKQFQKPVKGPK